MLTNLSSLRDQDFEVKPRSLRVTISEDGVLPISFKLPPIEEIEEIREFGTINVSVSEKIAPEVEERIRSTLNSELDSLKNKYEKFKGSSTYLNYLGSLSELVGDLESAVGYLAEARRLDGDIYFAHKEGSLLINRGRESEARALFEEMDLEKDVYANLRLAYLHAIKDELPHSLQFVHRALSIEPDNFGARLFAGALYLATGEYSKAVRNFRVAADGRESSSPLLVNLSIAQVCLGQTNKALRSLRQAIAVDPLNYNAIATYADLSARHGVGHSAIPALERFLGFEQKNADMWARLARAYFGVGEHQKALVALKREASNKESPSVWNNMGVVHLKQGQQPTAAKFFGRAIFGLTDEILFRDAGARAALLNIVSLLSNQRKYREAQAFSSNVIRRDEGALLAMDGVTADIYLLNLFSLLRLGKYDELVRASDEILKLPKAHIRLVMGTYLNLLSFFSVTNPDTECVMFYLEESIKLVKSLPKNVPKEESKAREELINNIVFVLAEHGRLQEAEQFATEIAAIVYKAPYPTATLALLQLKKGHGERGEELYRRAIALAKSKFDRHRIEQKMFLELGRLAFRTGKMSLAIKQFKRAKQISDGEAAIAQMASVELKLIKQLPSI